MGGRGRRHLPSFSWQDLDHFQDMKRRARMILGVNYHLNTSNVLYMNSMAISIIKCIPSITIRNNGDGDVQAFASIFIFIGWLWSHDYHVPLYLIPYWLKINNQSQNQQPEVDKGPVPSSFIAAYEKNPNFLLVYRFYFTLKALSTKGRFCII